MVKVIFNIQEGTQTISQDIDEVCMGTILQSGFIRNSVDQAWQAAIDAGYDTGKGCIMQCDLTDVQKLRSGVNAALKFRFGGDDTQQIFVVDKDNQAHPMTCADALALADEIEAHYWSLWERKQLYRQALAACQAIEDMEKVAF